MNANKGRIRALPSGVANNVRASHVIGSIERGVEELLQNSIIHGEAKKVTVTLGNDNTIIVEDDGVGIDNESMRTLIGTEACTNDASLEIFGSQGRGESLRCVAALCVEVTIESTFLSNNRSLVSSTKLIRNGVTISFEDSTDNKMSSSILPMMRSSIKTTQGTRITLRNFFQHFAVRRNHRSENLLSHVRSMLTLMSLIYPLVSFQLINGTGEVDVLLDASSSSEEFSGALTCRVPNQLGTSSATLEDEADALVDRMNKINSTNSDEDLGRTIKLAGEGGNVRAFGVIIVHDEDAICRGGRKMQFAVNGRPAAQAKQLTEFVQERIKKHFGGGSAYTTSGFIHIATKESELVINESTAMEMSNLGSITKLLAILITNAIDESMDAYRQHPSEVYSNNNDNRHSRIVKGEYITMNPSNGGIHRGQLSAGQSSPNQTPPNKSSPFSNIFCETNPQRNSADEDIKSNISFDEAFLDESITMEETTEMSYDDTEEAEPTMAWTRQRVKHFTSSIAELNPSGAQSDKISFTKDQLASAEVIAQVDSSFITVKMGSLLCLVDQHAADERVSLETLEEAFTRHDSHDGMKISLTKRDIHLGDIFKSCPVAPSIKVHLTMTQTTAARHYHSLLHKWKFFFEESKTEDRTIMLRGLPSVCGRVAQVDDMLEFLNDLGSLAGGSSIKPKFVSSVLASNACRYATMFGESMSLQQCKNLIEALAKCQLPFVCAHGRPSIIPLIDMAQKSTNKTDVVNITNDITRNRLEAYQRWGSKRLLNRK